jgi:hypothetical protein
MTMVQSRTKSDPTDATDRTAELRDELKEADARMELARLDFLAAQGEEPDTLRDKRRAWDHARAALAGRRFRAGA